MCECGSNKGGIQKVSAAAVGRVLKTIAKAGRRDVGVGNERKRNEVVCSFLSSQIQDDFDT